MFITNLSICMFKYNKYKVEVVLKEEKEASHHHDRRAN